jgi:peptidyl-prolyl cis-trans isomerase C
MKSRRIIQTTALVSLAVVTLAGCGAGAATGSAGKTSHATKQAASANTKATGKIPAFVPSATVGKETISSATVLMRTRLLALLSPTVTPSQAVTKSTATAALNQLINESLLLQGNPVKTDTALAKQDLLQFEQSLVSGYGSTATVTSREKALGLTPKDVSAFVTQEVTVEQAVAKYEPTVTAAEVAAYYKAHASTFKLTSPEVNARHILVKTQKEAEAILAKLKKGASFAALAKKYSEDTGSAAQGGNLGWFTASQMVQPFSKAAFSTPVNGYAIAHSVYGWHVIQVLGKEAKGTVPPLSQIQSQVQQAAQQAADQTNVQKALANLRKRFPVKVHTSAGQ